MTSMSALLSSIIRQVSSLLSPLQHTEHLLLLVRTGGPSALQKLLFGASPIDVNQRDHAGRTLLHLVCQGDRVDMLSVLLGHPDIDLNLRDAEGCSAFFVACSEGSTACARKLLEDKRVEITLPSHDSSTPLQQAASLGHVDIIRWWIASGRDLELGGGGGEVDGRSSHKDALKAAREVEYWHSDLKRERKAEVVRLLERFQENPGRTREEVRGGLGFFEEKAAALFAQVVFVCDRLAVVSPAAPASTSRFFDIACQLPMEIQMLLCFRAVGSCRDNITSRETDKACRVLVKSLHTEGDPLWPIRRSSLHH